MQSSLLCALVGGDHLQAINQQTKISFDCHQNRMLKNHKCQHPTQGGGGKQKEGAVKLVVCIGGGGHVQPANQNHL